MDFQMPSMELPPRPETHNDFPGWPADVTSSRKLLRSNTSEIVDDDSCISLDSENDPVDVVSRPASATEVALPNSFMTPSALIKASHISSSGTKEDTSIDESKQKSTVLRLPTKANKDIANDLKRPLSVGLAIAFFLFGFLWLLSLTPSISLCAITGLCNAVQSPSLDNSSHLMQMVDFPTLVEVQTGRLAEILDADLGTSTLALELKKVEMATADLITVVQYSSKFEPQTRRLIIEQLLEFVDQAKVTGRGMQKFSSRVWGSINLMITSNKHTLMTLESAASSSPSTSLDRRFQKAFNVALDTFSTEIADLVIQAGIQYRHHLDLDHSLDALRIILVKEQYTAADSIDDILSSMWTKMGGNREQLQSHWENIKLLEDMGRYRNEAKLRIATILDALERMQDGLEDLRRRVSVPRLLAAEEMMPMVDQIKVIRDSINDVVAKMEEAKVREGATQSRVLKIESSA